MIFGLIAGIAIGYFFKPQLDEVVVRIIKTVKNTQEKIKNKKDKQDYD